MFAVLFTAAVTFCEGIYQLDADIVGTVLADANFKDLASGEPTRRSHQGSDVGYPEITAALGVEALAAGLQDSGGDAYLELSVIGNDAIDITYDRWRVPIPYWSHVGDVTAGDLQLVKPTAVQDEPFDRHRLSIPWIEPSDLVDGSVSKLFGSGSDLYIFMCLYMTVNPSPSPGSGRHTIVTYDKGGDSTTVDWTILENARQNAAGELRKDRRYRLLWGNFAPQATVDKEALAVRVTVPQYPPLMFPGQGSLYTKEGMGRRVWFLSDSIFMNGDDIHKVEGFIGAACQPLAHLCWEDVGAAVRASS